MAPDDPLPEPRSRNGTPCLARRRGQGAFPRHWETARACCGRIMLRFTPWLRAKGRTRSPVHAVRLHLAHAPPGGQEPSPGRHRADAPSAVRCPSHRTAGRRRRDIGRAGEIRTRLLRSVRFRPVRRIPRRCCSRDPRSASHSPDAVVTNDSAQPNSEISPPSGVSCSTS